MQLPLKRVFQVMRIWVQTPSINQLRALSFVFYSYFRIYKQICQSISENYCTFLHVNQIELLFATTFFWQSTRESGQGVILFSPVLSCILSSKDSLLNNVYKSFNLIINIHVLYRMCSACFSQLMVNIMVLLSVLYAKSSPILKPSILYWIIFGRIDRAANPIAANRTDVGNDLAHFTSKS